MHGELLISPYITKTHEHSLDSGNSEVDSQSEFILERDLPQEAVRVSLVKLVLVKILAMGWKVVTLNWGEENGKYVLAMEKFVLEFHVVEWKIGRAHV